MSKQDRVKTLWNMTREYNRKGKEIHSPQLVGEALYQLEVKQSTILDYLEELVNGYKVDGQILRLKGKVLPTPTDRLELREIEAIKKEIGEKESFELDQETIGNLESNLEDYSKLKLKILNFCLHYGIDKPHYGLRKIAKTQNLSTETVSRNLENLEELGILKTEKTKGNKGLKIFSMGSEEKREEIQDMVQGQLYPQDLMGWVSKTQNQDKEGESIDYLPEGFGLVKNQAEVNSKTYTYWKLARWNKGKNHSPKYIKSLGNVDKVTKKEAKEKAIDYLKTTWVSKNHPNWVSKISPHPTKNTKRVGKTANKHLV